jgi:hypothetical protein
VDAVRTLIPGSFNCTKGFNVFLYSCLNTAMTNVFLWKEAGRLGRRVLPIKFAERWPDCYNV